MINFSNIPGIYECLEKQYRKNQGFEKKLMTEIEKFSVAVANNSYRKGFVMLLGTEGEPGEQKAITWSIPFKGNSRARKLKRIVFEWWNRLRRDINIPNVLTVRYLLDNVVLGLSVVIEVFDVNGCSMEITFAENNESIQCILRMTPIKMDNIVFLNKKEEPHQ